MITPTRKNPDSGVEFLETIVRKPHYLPAEEKSNNTTEDFLATRIHHSKCVEIEKTEHFE